MPKELKIISRQCPHLRIVNSECWQDWINDKQITAKGQVQYHDEA